MTSDNTASVTRYNVSIEGLMDLPTDTTIKDVYSILAKDGKDTRYALTYENVTYDNQNKVKIVDITIKRVTNIEYF